MPGEMNAKKHEFIGVFLLLICILLLLCLATYHPGDSSLNSLSSTPAFKNQIGRIGAYISDFLFQLFGYPAYLLLAPLAVLGVKLISGRALQMAYFRIIGFVFVISSVCALFQMIPLQSPDSGFMPGGITGVFIYDLLYPNLNAIGTIIVLLGGLIMGMLACTPLTLAGLFGRKDKRFRMPFSETLDRFREWLHKRRSLKAVVNIKPSRAPEPPERTPRPEPI